MFTRNRIGLSVIDGKKSKKDEIYIKTKTIMQTNKYIVQIIQTTSVFNELQSNYHLPQGAITHGVWYSVPTKPILYPVYEEPPADLRLYVLAVLKISSNT